MLGSSLESVLISKYRWHIVRAGAQEGSCSPPRKHRSNMAAVMVAFSFAGSGVLTGAEDSAGGSGWHRCRLGAVVLQPLSRSIQGFWMLALACTKAAAGVRRLCVAGGGLVVRSCYYARTGLCDQCFIWLHRAGHLDCMSIQKVLEPCKKSRDHSDWQHFLCQ